MTLQTDFICTTLTPLDGLPLEAEMVDKVSLIAQLTDADHRSMRRLVEVGVLGAVLAVGLVAITV